MAEGFADAYRDWRRLAGFAMTRLGWPPEVFWAATPADLLAAVEALHGRRRAAPLARAELDALWRRFPDRAGIDRRAQGTG